MFAEVFLDLVFNFFHDLGQRPAAILFANGRRAAKRFAPRSRYAEAANAGSLPMA